MLDPSVSEGFTMTNQAIITTEPDAYLGDDNPDNNISAIQNLVDVNVVEPIVGLSASNDSPMLVGNLTTLTATITSGTDVYYLWAFSNGGTSTNRVTTHLFGAVGIHSATVTATNSLGSFMAVTEIMIGEAVTLSVGTETYTTSDGSLNLQMPTALTETVAITYTPLTAPSHAAGNPIIELDPPFTLTLYYDDSGLPAGTDETLLTLQRYDTDTSNWVELTVIERDITANYIAVSLGHLSEFALLLEAQHRIYLPLVNR
jgi:PKD repeat protein